MASCELADRERECCDRGHSVGHGEGGRPALRSKEPDALLDEQWIAAGPGVQVRGHSRRRLVGEDAANQFGGRLLVESGEGEANDVGG